MTDKRFKLVDIGFVYDDDKLIGMKEIVDLLNELNDENQALMEEIKDYQELLANKEETLCEPIIKENTHIKHTIKVMLENERTEIGKNTLKQLWEAI